MSEKIKELFFIFTNKATIFYSFFCSKLFFTYAIVERLRAFVIFAARVENPSINSTKKALFEHRACSILGAALSTGALVCA